MNNFKKGGKGGFSKGGFKGGRPSFGGGKRFGGGFRGTDRPERSFEKRMYEATCAACGKTTEVPFRPTGERPVYCRECFRKEEGGDRRESYSDAPRYDAGRSERRERPEREFRPQTKTYDSGELDSLKRQIVALDSKIDRILQMVTKAAPLPEPAEAPGANYAPLAAPPKKKLVKKTAKKAGKKK